MTSPKRQRDPVKMKAYKQAYLKRYWAARRVDGKPYPLMFFVQTNDEMMAAVRARAAKSGVSMSELIRTYIEWGLENDNT